MKHNQEVFHINNNHINNEPPLTEKLISLCLTSQPKEVEKVLASKDLELSIYDNLKV